MEKVRFGRTGLQVSQLGFGAAPIGYLNTEREKVRKILNLMLDRGVNVIDTAASYEGSEEAIAEAIGHRRKEFVLISKRDFQRLEAQARRQAQQDRQDAGDAAESRRRMKEPGGIPLARLRTRLGR